MGAQAETVDQSLINFRLLLGKSSIVRYFSQFNHSRPAAPPGPLREFGILATY